MSEWSYSEEELDQYFQDASTRRSAASPNGQPQGPGPDRPSEGIRGYFHRRFSDRKKAQAAFVLSVITGVLLLCTLAGGLYIWSLTDNVPTTQRLENPTFQLATIAYTADGKELARYALQNRSWVPYDSISTHAIHALIATEDRRFYEHWGVDLKGIMAAMVDITTGDFRGASTITQQLARNLYNETVGRAVTIERKIKEMVTAVELERRYTKREIIEMYLNTVSFGSNAYGIDAAARTYFGVPASGLNRLQAATLIGSLQATTYYNPVRNPGNARRRRNVVLRQMQKMGYVDDLYYESHRDDPVDASYHSAELYASLAPYFAEYVRNWMADWADRHGRSLYTDGLRVYTTIDSELQNRARQAVEEQMSGLQKAVEYEWSESNTTVYSTDLEAYRSLEPGTDYEPFSHFWATKTGVVRAFIRSTDRYRNLRDQGLDEDAAIAQLQANEVFVDSLKAAKLQLGAGLVSMDPRNGHVKAWVGGRDFRKDKYDKVALATRQPGSTFKPFTYTAAIDNGWRPYDRLRDSTFTWQDTGADTTWSPQNFSGSTGEMLTLSQGLARSKNTITARLALDINPSTVATYARRMGITTPLDEVPSIALGTSDVKLLDMTTAYSTLASGGLRHEPVVVTRIEDRYGNVIWESTPRTEEALSERTAYTVVDMMRGVIDYGTGIRMRTQFELGSYDLAGKTGTTQNAADTWFMAMHPNLVTGAWVGFNDHRVTFRTNWWGQGSHSALLVVGDYYRRLMNAEQPTPFTEDATFPLIENYGTPDPGRDSTDQDRGVGW
jgi:penicillin-binding protein 1A